MTELSGSSLLVASLIIAILCVTGLILPLLWQLRKTAVSLERFFDSATKDLHQVATDVHEARSRIDEIAGTVRGSADSLASFSRSVSNLGASLQIAAESVIGARALVTKSVGGVVGALSAGVSIASFLRRRMRRRAEAAAVAAGVAAAVAKGNANE